MSTEKILQVPMCEKTEKIAIFSILLKIATQNSPTHLSQLYLRAFVLVTVHVREIDLLTVRAGFLHES